MEWAGMMCWASRRRYCPGTVAELAVVKPVSKLVPSMKKRYCRVLASTADTAVAPLMVTVADWPSLTGPLLVKDEKVGALGSTIRETGTWTVSVVDELHSLKMELN